MQRRTMVGGIGASLFFARKGYAMTCQPLRPNWRYVADTVMGGVSTGQITPIKHAGQQAMRLTGSVSLENNGGFIQMAFNPADAFAAFDASTYKGISFEAKGNGETYAVNLRTNDLTRPWQSYRAEFTAGQKWRWINLPFSAFEPSNTDIPLNTAGLRRVGVIAVGRAFEVDVAVASICFRA
ncbi:MAG: CIA30 family protein [Pseudomonadota bacterium]